MAALWSLASLRKRGKRPLPTSPAPSHEKITNCGGVSPGSSRRGFSGWCGCGPESAVEPSPIGLALACTAFLSWSEPDPEPEPVEQPATPSAAAAPTPMPSTFRRLIARIPSSPSVLVTLNIRINGHRVRGIVEHGGSGLLARFYYFACR